MKRTIQKLIVLLLSISMVFALVGCSKKNQLVGTWEYKDEESGIGAVYDLKKDGTGTYAVTVGESTVNYELKYEVKDGHLLVRFVNDSVFSEDDVFDSEFTLKDSGTMILKDTSGMEMTFIKK